MMTKYENGTQNISLEDIREILKHIAEMISKPSKYIFNKIKSSSKIEYSNKQSLTIRDDERYIELYNSMDSLALSLKKNELFYDEYFDFCEIQDMIKDTLNRDDSLIKQSDLQFILDLIEDFSQLLNYKIDLIENKNFNEMEFNSRYDSYLTKFHKSQIYFYKNICDETLDDDLFIEYTNIILE